jgi:hypothetical protein
MWLYLPPTLTPVSSPATAPLTAPSAESFDSLAASCTWRTSSQPSKGWRRVWNKEPSLRRLCGPTLARSQQDRSEAVRTWLSADSPAPTSAWQDGATASTESTPASSSLLQMPFATWDRATSSWKTSQPSLFGDSTPFSGRWPTSGSMRNGAVFERRTLARHIAAIGGGASHGTERQWPTATADRVSQRTDTRFSGDGRETPNKLGWAAAEVSERLWATMAAGNFNDSESPESWHARADLLKEKHNNGNGAGIPLAVQAKKAVGKMWQTIAATEVRQGYQQRPEGMASQQNQQSLSTQAVDFLRGLRSRTTPKAGCPSWLSGPSLPPLFLNPLFAEWLMWGRDGIGLTCLGHPATATAPIVSGDSATRSARPRLKRPCVSSGSEPSASSRDAALLEPS